MWKTAIDNHKKLVKARPDPSFWSSNIIDATNCLTDSKDWKIFYSYLTQGPRFFNIENPVIGPTIGDIQIPDIPDYLPNQSVEVFQNGSDQIIYVKTIQSETDSDDEKVE